MRKVLFSLMLLCGLTLISTSCNKDNNGNNGNNGNVTPEVQNNEITVGSTTSDIVTAKAFKYGQKNAIVFASKEMTAADNEGIAIIFNGNIVPGTYTMADNSKNPVPTVVGFHEFNLGELPFIMGADTLFYGDTYYWMNGELSITEENGTYTVILSQSMGVNDNGQTIQLALNFNGALSIFQLFEGSGEFIIGSTESTIGMASLTQLRGLSPFGLDVKSMLFMSADRKRCFIVSYGGGQLVDGEYNLGYIGTPYLPAFPCVHVALDGDFWTFQAQTGYVAKSGTLKVTTNDDGTTVIMENLKLKNVEHENEFLWPILDGSLQYTGYMYEVSL